MYYAPIFERNVRKATSGIAVCAMKLTQVCVDMLENDTWADREAEALVSVMKETMKGIEEGLVDIEGDLAALRGEFE